MKQLLFLAALLFPLGVHAQRELKRYKEPKQIKAEKDVWEVTDNEGFWIVYEQPKEMLAKFEKEAALKMWNTEQKAVEQAKLPPGGWIKSRVVGSLYGADPHVLTFIIQDAEGNEIQRFQPKSDVPHVFSLQYSIYVSDIVVPLQQPLGQNYRVFVVNDAKKVRHEFLIRPL